MGFFIALQLLSHNEVAKHEGCLNRAFISSEFNFFAGLGL